MTSKFKQFLSLGGKGWRASAVRDVTLLSPQHGTGRISIVNNLRVLVLWADDKSANFGVRALANGTASLIETSWRRQADIDMQNFAPGDSELSFGLRLVLKDIGRKEGDIKLKIGQYDVVVDTGAGDSFTDIYGLKRLFVMLYTQRVARKLKIPVIMSPQTVGPFNTLVGKYAARHALRTASLVVARDSLSASYALTLGRKVDAVSTDVVFALPEPSKSRSRDVILNISGLLWSGSRHLDAERYRLEVFQLVAGLEQRGRKVSLLAHVVAPGFSDSDVSAIEEFARGFGQNLELIIPTSLDEIRSAIAGASLVIGARMHACLNALSLGKPAIAWAYSRKFAPLMNDIGWPHVFNLADPKVHIAAETLKILDVVGQQGLDTMALEVQKRARAHLAPAILALKSFETV